MSEIKLTLDGDALRAATVQAMMGVLTPDVQERMVRQAIEAMLRPGTSGYDKQKSPIEIAFNVAVDKVAREVAAELVAADITIRERLQELARTTADKILNADVDKLSERMADAFVASIKRDSY